MLPSNKSILLERISQAETDIGEILQYTVFDQLKQRMLKGKQTIGDKGSSPEALSAFSAFVLGAVAKSIATVITYPAIRCIIVLSNTLHF